LRERYDEITAHGADLIAIGTGNQRYATSFIRDEHIPYMVLVDDDAAAARAASVRVLNFAQLVHPRTWRASVNAWRNGHKIHKAGARVNQLGATFVIGPGDQVRYEHIDSDSTDHAPVADLVAAVRDN
jgi:peroxiredoxin